LFFDISITNDILNYWGREKKAFEQPTPESADEMGYLPSSDSYNASLRKELFILLVKNRWESRLFLPKNN
jgi:hypothetical protein